MNKIITADMIKPSCYYLVDCPNLESDYFVEPDFRNQNFGIYEYDSDDLIWRPLTETGQITDSQHYPFKTLEDVAHCLNELEGLTDDPHEFYDEARLSNAENLLINHLTP